MKVKIEPAKNQPYPINSVGALCAPDEEPRLGIRTEIRTGSPYERGYVVVRGDTHIVATSAQRHNVNVEIVPIRGLDRGPRIESGEEPPWEAGILAQPMSQNTGKTVLQIRKLTIEADGRSEHVYSAFLLEHDFVSFGHDWDNDYEAHLPGQWPDSEVVFQVRL